MRSAWLWNIIEQLHLENRSVRASLSVRQILEDTKRLLEVIGDERTQWKYSPRSFERTILYCVGWGFYEQYHAYYRADASRMHSTPVVQNFQSNRARLDTCAGALANGMAYFQLSEYCIFAMCESETLCFQYVLPSPVKLYATKVLRP